MLTQSFSQAENEQGITAWVDRNDKTGEFKRNVSQFRDAISAKPGAQFPPEKGRYHLYVSYACPWGKGCCSADVRCWHLWP